MPQANSTTSSPRVSSPLASAKVLPCSAVMMAARRSALVSTSSRKRNRDRARTWGAVAAQAGKAAAAACTARSTMAASARAASPVTAPVAGL